MRFAALGERKNPAVLFFHAMGVMGESSELVAKYLQERYFVFCKLKPTLIKAGMCHIQDESKEEIAYAQDMFETILKDYKQEKDVYISSLLTDLINQTPVTEKNFAALEGKIRLILPNQDFFSGTMQQDLIRLMREPKISYVSGGHLSTVLKAEDYVRTIRDFLGRKNEMVEVGLGIFSLPTGYAEGNTTLQLYEVWLDIRVMVGKGLQATTNQKRLLYEAIGISENVW